MQIFFFSILSLIFCFINYKIIVSDQKIKKIPNKNLLQLLILLPFWYIFLYFFPIGNFEIFGFILQIFASFLISFLLFNFGIWRAGDAKYLLILSLFIPHIGIISFIGNLGLFTLFYLFLYFLWFFFGKSFFIKGYLSSLTKSIKIDLQEKWKFYKNSQKGNTFFIIFKWILVFLIIFVSLRLARIYLFLEFFENFSANKNILEIVQKYHFYLIFVGIGVIIGIYYIGKKIINFLKFFFANIFKIDIKIIGKIFLTILFFTLIWFIFTEFQKNPEEISNYLIKIFTIYIFIYIFAKIIFYSYKLSFLNSEEKFIHIDNLKTGDIVDKKYLLNYSKYLNKNYIESKGIIIPKKFYKFFNQDNYINYIQSIKILSKEDIFYIKRKIEEIKKINLLYKNKKEIEILNIIKILNTFSFAKFIFIGFIITFLLENKIITTIFAFLQTNFVNF